MERNHIQVTCVGVVPLKTVQTHLFVTRQSVPLLIKDIGCSTKQPLAICACAWSSQVPWNGNIVGSVHGYQAIKKK